MRVKELVVAGSYDEYMDYMRQTQKSMQEVKYVCALEQLMGYALNSMEITYVGHADRNPVYDCWTLYYIGTITVWNGIVDKES